MSLNVSGTNLLPAFSKPYEDELLSSWLARMAFDHGLSTRELCTLIWAGYYGQDMDRLASDDQMCILATKVNSTLEEVRSMTLHSYENKLLAK